jgi:hypothetical protein
MLEEVPDLRRQIAQLPGDAPIVEHVAERLDGPVEKRLLFGGKFCRRKGEKLLPIGLAAEELAIPPHVARLDRLALGGGEARQGAAREAEDGLGDPVAAEGRFAHAGLGQSVGFSTTSPVVVPAQAGTHDHRLWNMDPRFRGDDTDLQRAHMEFKSTLGPAIPHGARRPLRREGNLTAQSEQHIVIAGLDPAIHRIFAKSFLRRRWMRGSSPRMTTALHHCTTPFSTPPPARAQPFSFPRRVFAPGV